LKQTYGVWWKKLRKRLQDLPKVLTHQAAKVFRFKDVAESYEHIVKRIDGAECSVDDITWGSRTGYRTKPELDAYKGYAQCLDRVCSKGRVKYREISSLANEEYFRRSVDLLNKNYYSYHLGYYDTSSVRMPPLISYVIIDRAEAIFGFYRAPVLPIDGEIHVRVTDKDLVDLFCDYFETLWTGSIKIKESAKIDWDRIEAIANRLERAGAHFADLPFPKKAKNES
jgi:hypothetical protein